MSWGNVATVNGPARWPRPWPPCIAFVLKEAQASPLALTPMRPAVPGPKSLVRRERGSSTAATMSPLDCQAYQGGYVVK